MIGVIYMFVVPLGGLRVNIHIYKYTLKYQQIQFVNSENIIFSHTLLLFV